MWGSGTAKLRSKQVVSHVPSINNTGGFIVYLPRFTVAGSSVKRLVLFTWDFSLGFVMFVQLLLGLALLLL